MQVQRRIREGLRPSQPEEMPEDVHSLLQKMLLKDPKSRPGFGDMLPKLLVMLSEARKEQGEENTRDIGQALLDLHSLDV